jgi:hypothetical protein
MFKGLDINYSSGFNLLAFSEFIIIFDKKFRNFNHQYLKYLIN